MEDNIDLGFLRPPEDGGFSLEEKPKKKKYTPKPKPEPLYLATITTTYRFLCDGTTIHLVDGVSPQGLNPRQIKELKKYGRIKEVK